MTQVADSEASLILDDAWAIARLTPFISRQVAGGLRTLPDLSPEGAEATAATARDLLGRIDALDLDQLPSTLSAPLRQARYSADIWSRADTWYWTVIDPGGVGFYGMFLPSPYCGGIILNFAFDTLAHMPLDEPDDLDRYLDLCTGLAVMLEQWRARTVGQAARGMLMPRAQIPTARGLLAAFAERSISLADLGDIRFADTTRHLAPAFRETVRQRIVEAIQPAFASVADVFDLGYESAAPESVGLSQYEGGADIYRHLVRIHTTMDLTPEEVHDLGRTRLQSIEADMRRIRAEAGFADDPAGYVAAVFSNPRFRAANSSDVTVAFQRYIDRMDVELPRAFHAGPLAPFDVAPLPVAMQGGMTFGYYEPPGPGRDEGRFHFNSTHLTSTPLLGLASLTYHELVPGHHFHFATQNSNDRLHPISRHAFCNAFNEGWAEYAATLAGELGCYADPAESFGRYAMEAFLTCRLVVDTGMNALGWSLDEAREFMRAHTTMSDAEIDSETLRYSCDVPAQALAYKLGEPALLSLREDMRSALQARGRELDLRDFHEAVLAFGAMPLPDLEHEVGRRLLATSTTSEGTA